MSCDVCLSGVGGGEDSEFYFDRTVTVRKQHNCAECQRPILVGSKSKIVGGKCDGEFWRYRVCLECYEINNVFSCDNGTMWGNFWEEMFDYVLPALKTSSPCFNKLSMPARALVTEQWWKWKELHGAV